MSLTDQVLALGETAEVTAERVRTALGLVPEEEYLLLLDIIAQRRAVDVFGAVQRQADGGVDLMLLLAGIGSILRAQLTVALGGVPPELSERMRLALNERKGQLSAGDLLRMLHALLELEPMYRRSGQPQLLLETLLDKQRILEIYLNSVEWGEGIFGAEAAAQHYFRKPAARLSPYEAARLAVMLPRPRYFETRPNSDYLATRANAIVARMGSVDLP